MRWCQDYPEIQAGADALSKSRRDFNKSKKRADTKEDFEDRLALFQQEYGKAIADGGGAITRACEAAGWNPRTVRRMLDPRCASYCEPLYDVKTEIDARHREERRRFLEENLREIMGEAKELAKPREQYRVLEAASKIAIQLDQLDHNQEMDRERLLLRRSELEARQQPVLVNHRHRHELRMSNDQARRLFAQAEQHFALAGDVEEPGSDDVIDADLIEN